MKVIDAFALSPMQEAFYFNSQLDDGAYIVQYAYQFDGQLNINIFQQAINQLVKNNDTLRTAFVSQGFSKPLQVIFDERQIKLSFHNLQSKNSDENKLIIEEFKIKNAQKPFNLATDPLLRITIFKTNEESHWLVWEYHHILMDGWCITLLTDEFNQIYTQLAERKTPKTLPKPSYKNFVKWLEKQDDSRANDFWSNYLKDIQTNCIVPQISNSTHQDNSNFNDEFTIKLSNIRIINQFCSQNRVTLSTFLQTIWGVLLGRYNNTTDVVFGTISAVRPPEIISIDKMIGLFVNTIPVRICSKPNQSIIDLLREIQQENLEKSKHEFISLPQINANTTFKKDLINHLFVIDNNSEIKENTQYSKGENNVQINYSFSVHAHCGEQVTLRFTFDNQLYSARLIREIAIQYKYLINQIIENNQILVDDLKVLNAKDEQHYFQLFSNHTSFGSEETISTIIEKVVEKNPEKIAIRFKEETITYKDLWIKATNIAHHLNQKINNKNKVVAVIADKSAIKVACILGVFRSKATYLPLIPTIPIERKKYILQDTQTKLIITERKYLASLEWFDGEIILMDTLPNQSIDTIKIERKSVEDNAYIIYTSGTSGKPKGVPIREKSFVSRTLFHNNYLNLTSNDIFLQFASNSFDASLIEIFMALTVGGSIVVPDEFTKGNLLELERLISTCGVTMAILPPAILKSFDKNLPSCLQHIITTGEEASIDDAIFYAQTKNIYNGYGPTESCLGATFHKIDYSNKEIYQKIGKIPVGFPFAQTTVLILDNQHRIVPEGGIGEVYIAGIGLSSGYINNQTLTNEVFIRNPFATNENDQWIYKTGDLGKWNKNHGIEFYGRIDNQIQIRGIRVELGEIEAVMTKLLPIQKSVVMLHDLPDRKQLVGYYKATKCNKINHSEWRNILRKHLPDFMIPSIFVSVKEFLLTINGKIDKSSLPKPTIISKKNRDFTPTEKLISMIWKDLLNLKAVNLSDNFFELGGHSLIAIKLSSRILKDLNKKVSINEIFENPTVEELSNFINNSEKNNYIPIPKINEREFYKASKAQSRMWILSQISESSNYNLQACFWLKGIINIDILGKALSFVQQRHEILRTYFQDQEANIVQIIDKNPDLPFSYIERPTNEENIRAAFEKELSYNFPLTHGSQWRLVVYKQNQNTHACCLTAHHSILDAWSLEILIEELAQIYNNLTLGKVPHLNELAIQYKDFVAWQESENINQTKQYWIEKLSGELPVLDFPIDFERPAIKSTLGKVISFTIDKTDMSSFSQKNQFTFFTILLTTLNLLLRKYSDQSDIIIGTPTAQRQHPDLENQVGLYLNTLCLRMTNDQTLAINSLLENAKLTIEEALNNQNYPFDNLVENLGIRRQASRMPIFDVMISYMGAIKQSKNSSFKGLEIENFPKSDIIASKFDLEWFFSETADSIECQLIYDTALFTENSTQKLIKHFKKLLAEIITEENQSKSIGSISMLSEEEKKYQLEILSQDFASPKIEITDVFIKEFEKIVEKNPKEPAFYEEESMITYAQANEKANQYARYLSNHYSIENEKIVAVLSNRSTDLLISILALQKLGIAFLPIDPNIPSERVRFMCEDAGVSFILTSPICNYSFEDLPHQNTIFYDEYLWKKYENHNLTISPCLHDLAYVIYTSGSTGTPKGVMVSNENLMNYLLWANNYYFNNQAGQPFSFFTSISFDLTITSIFSPLLRADTVYVYSDLLPINEIMERVFEENSPIKTVKLTPSHISILNKFDGYLKASIKTAIVGGEELRPEHIRILKEINPEMKIFNEYGPTETTVGCTIELIENYDQRQKISIGKPISNTQIYILDQNMQLLPFGAKGEIYIGGKSVAKGYLKNPALSEKKFVLNPFKPNEIIYKTGDLAKWLIDGKIECFGRKDNQVKINGYRIELGEVERQIEQILNVEHVAIKLEKNGEEPQMIAFLQSQKSFSVKEIRAKLKEFMPIYMIPNQFVFLENLPININGKVDLSKLNFPLISKTLHHDNGQSANPIETKLIAIYSQILKHQSITIEDDFFELGGNSIKAFELINAIKKEFEVKLSLKDIFNDSSIKKISTKVELILWATEKPVVEQVLIEI